VFVQFLTSIRVLFPKWNFFDQLGHRFHLKYRESNSSNWSLLEFKSDRTFINFFFNPTHNLTLAQINIIEHFARDVQLHEPNQIESLVSFKLVKSLTEAYLPAFSKSDSFQFLIEAYDQNSNFKLYESVWMKKDST